VTARLDLVIFDAADIDAVGSFYAGLAGWEVVRRGPDRFDVRDPWEREVGFQRAPDHVAPSWPGQERPRHFQLNLMTWNLEASAERMVALGAVPLSDSPGQITLADPAGHPFTLFHAPAISWTYRTGEASEPPLLISLRGIVIDAPDASALGGFYARLTGMEGTHYNGPAGVEITDSHGGYLTFREVSGYNPPRWPDPAYPQQAHLDLLVDDLDASEATALELGASRLSAGGDRFRVFADPAAHPFCLVRSPRAG
jgi:hypothetical protein